jgi:hypothetical protein
VNASAFGRCSEGEQRGKRRPLPSAGLPGLRGVDHVGITVPVMEQATAFSADVPS